MDEETKKALVELGKITKDALIGQGLLLQSYEKILNAQSVVIAQMAGSLLRIEKKLGTDPDAFKMNKEDFEL